MTLALLLTAVTGAWAQSTFGVVEFKVPAEWANDNNPVTAADLPGFKAVTLDEAKAWTGAPAEGYAILFYAFDGNKINLVNYANGGVSSDGPADFTKKIVFDNKSNGKFYYTVEPTEWSLTPDADKKVWTLAKMPASDIELQVEYEPTKVTLAANDKTMGTVEVAGESKVEWTADTWKGWTADIKEHTVDDITITGTQKTSIYELTSEDKYKNSLLFFVVKVWDNSTVTFSTTGDPFSRIEFTMIDDYSESNPNIIPNDNWTVEGKSAVWEGEATKSLTLQSCSTQVSKITFFKGAIPDGVTINGDGTFTVAKTATVTLKATPAEGYKFLYWEDDQTNTNPVREVTIESGMADMTYKAVFAEITYNVTFADGIEEADKWKAEPNAAAKNTEVKVTYSGAKKVLGMKVEKKAAKPDDEGHALSASAVGEIVGSDGKAYAVADKDDLPSGVTAVAMVAYKSGSNGLAIQLNGNPVSMKWAQAKTYVEGLTAVPGGTWRLPSKADWQNMFVGCAVSGDATVPDADSEMDPIAGFQAKIAAAGITWKSGDYWTSTGDDSIAWMVGVNLEGSYASASFGEIPSSFAALNVLGCLAF